MSDLYTAQRQGNNVQVKNVDCLALSQTLDCGQAFRWQPLEENIWQGVAMGRILKVQRRGADFILHDTSLEEYHRVWKNYFDLNRDYRKIINAVAPNPLLSLAAEFAYGIRILRQDIWEMICSFIISQNNNIPRIKGIISRLCALYGERLDDENYAFPKPEKLAAGGIDGLAPIRAGFRAKYLIDAAEKISLGEINFTDLYIADIEDARQTLCKIKGIGPKVADCVLLFGAGRVEAFPMDVWIKRVMAAHFPEGLPREALPTAGIIQQYLFHSARMGLLD